MATVFQCVLCDEYYNVKSQTPHNYDNGTFCCESCKPDDYYECSKCKNWYNVECVIRTEDETGCYICSYCELNN